MRDLFPAHPLRVLVVDDCKDTRETLEMLLTAWGYEVRLAHDGRSTLDAFRAFHPDVVLLDIGLPDLNGWELAPRLRRLDGSPNLLLVAMTGHGREEDHQHSHDAGFDVHMTKPADLGELQRFLANASRALILVEAA